MRLPRRRLLLVALPLVLVTGVALAAQPGGRRPSNAVINACVKKKTAASASWPPPPRAVETSCRLPGTARGRQGRPVPQAGPAQRGRPVRPDRKAIRAHAAQPERQEPRAVQDQPVRKGLRGLRCSSLESLNGVGCHAGGHAGTAPLTYDANGVATIICATSGGGGTSTLRVNELMTGSTGAAANEFVEIVNTGTAAADISGFRLAYRSSAGTSDVTLATVPTGTTLAAGGFYLFGGSAYAGTKAPDQSFSTAIAATGGGVALRDSAGAILDSVGYGDAVNAFVEGHTASAPPATAAPGSSAVRLPDGHDTNDNAADFSVSASPTPGSSNH